MLVSKKFHASLIERINSSFDPTTAAQLVSLVNARVDGSEPLLDGCSETVRMIFTFILSDIEKAIARSARCREAARRRKEARSTVKTDGGVSAPQTREIVIGDIDEDHELVLTIPPGLSRAERRRLEREARRQNRKFVNNKEKPGGSS